jgi:hypothetical protein
MHSVESGDGDHLVSLALSEGSVTTLLEAGVGGVEVGLDRLRADAAELREPASVVDRLPRLDRAEVTRYSHSIVAGGFDVTSSTTRFTAGISLTIREEIVSISS